MRTNDLVRSPCAPWAAVATPGSARAEASAAEDIGNNVEDCDDDLNDMI